MTDPALERIWESRRSISAKCDYDAHRLVEYMQTHKRKSRQFASTDGHSWPSLDQFAPGLVVRRAGLPGGTLGFGATPE